MKRTLAACVLAVVAPVFVSTPLSEADTQDPERVAVQRMP